MATTFSDLSKNLTRIAYITLTPTVESFPRSWRIPLFLFPLDNGAILRNIARTVTRAPSVKPRLCSRCRYEKKTRKCSISGSILSLQLRKRVFIQLLQEETFPKSVVFYVIPSSKLTNICSKMATVI